MAVVSSSASRKDRVKSLVQSTCPNLYPFAKSVYRKLGSLSVLDIAMIGVLYPVRLAVRHSYVLFVTLYRALDFIDEVRPFRYRPAGGLPIAVDEQVKGVVAELKKNGVAVWRGFFQEADCARINAYLDELLPRGEAGFRRLAGQVDGFADPVYPGFEHTRELVEPEFEAYGLENLSDVYGRRRVRVYRTPAELKNVFENDLIGEIASRYLGHSVGHKRVLLEELAPSLMTDTWHVDNIGTSFKAMVLTTDCTMQNGPLRYKVGTHRGMGWGAKLRANWLMLRFGYSFSSINLLEYRTMDAKVFWGTGKVGDVIFFDPSGIHAGSRALSGVRRSIVVPKVSRKLQNRVFGWLGGISY